jgi:subtilisin family serine protease
MQAVMSGLLGRGTGVGYALGISWDDAKPKPKTFAVFALGLVLLALLASGLPAATERTSTGVRAAVSLIVRRAPGSGDAADEQVRQLGGQVDRQLGIVDSFSATVPAEAVPVLQRSAAVLSAAPNARVHLLGRAYSQAKDFASLYNTTKVTGIRNWWQEGYTGKGVTIALVDTGITPVNGLRTAGKVIYGPDLSFESQAPNLRNLDTYGHGTHLAGIIAGRDDAAQLPYHRGNRTDFVGVAPDAQLLSVKIGDAAGATDVSQMIAAIDWVVQHRNDNGMNVRVLNLSFGTDSAQSYILDPLAHAAEVAWRHGIVVVAAAGNGGHGDTRLESPAYDPYLVAVGSLDLNRPWEIGDDVPATFSSRGDGVRNPDVLAAGKSLASLRVPGSYIDAKYGDTAAAGDRFLRGSGTSQSAALVSGAVALILQQRPELQPDQVKALLTGNTVRLANVSTAVQGSGALSMSRVLVAPTPLAVQTHVPAAGTGSLDASRAGSRLTHDGVTLAGEQDIFGQAWDSTSHAALAAAGQAWDGGTFNGSTWTGSTWTGSTWTGSTWTGSTWTGSSWSSVVYSGSTWTGSTWTGSTWTGSTWTGSTWTGSTWLNSIWE